MYQENITCASLSCDIMHSAYLCCKAFENDKIVLFTCFNANILKCDSTVRKTERENVEWMDR